MTAHQLLYAVGLKDTLPTGCSVCVPAQLYGVLSHAALLSFVLFEQFCFICDSIVFFSLSQLNKLQVCDIFMMG